MARFTILLLGAVLLGLASIAVGIPPGSMSAPGAISKPIAKPIGKPLFRSFGLGRDTTRIDDRLERRDFIWTYTRDRDQNLCSLSNFVKVDDNGPRVSACKIFAKYNTDGYWLVSGFESSGSDWKRFASVQSCVMAIRRTDGQTDQVPIGNQDVNDLMKSVIDTFGGGDTLPAVQGNMTCSKKYAGTAAVEWKIYEED